MNSQTLPQSIFFSSILLAGSVLFLAVSAFGVDWFAPSMIMIVATAIGWDRFMNSEGEAYNKSEKEASNREAQEEFSDIFQENLRSTLIVPDLSKIYAESILEDILDVKVKRTPRRRSRYLYMPKRRKQTKVD